MSLHKDDGTRPYLLESGHPVVERYAQVLLANEATMLVWKKFARRMKARPSKLLQQNGRLAGLMFNRLPEGRNWIEHKQNPSYRRPRARTSAATMMDKLPRMQTMADVWRDFDGIDQKVVAGGGHRMGMMLSWPELEVIGSDDPSGRVYVAWLRKDQVVLGGGCHPMQMSYYWKAKELYGEGLEPWGNE